MAARSPAIPLPVTVRRRALWWLRFSDLADGYRAGQESRRPAGDVITRRGDRLLVDAAKIPTQRDQGNFPEAASVVSLRPSRDSTSGPGLGRGPVIHTWRAPLVAR
jgi:hypothetical protein